MIDVALGIDPADIEEAQQLAEDVQIGAEADPSAVGSETPDEFKPLNNQQLSELNYPVCAYCSGPCTIPVLYPARFHVCCLGCAVDNINSALLRFNVGIDIGPGRQVMVDCKDESCTDKNCGRVLMIGLTRKSVPFFTGKLPFDALPQPFYTFTDWQNQQNKIVTRCPWCHAEGSTRWIVSHILLNQCLAFTLNCHVCSHPYLLSAGFKRHAIQHRRMITAPEFKAGDLPPTGPHNSKASDVMTTCFFCWNICTTPVNFGCEAGHLCCLDCLVHYHFATDPSPRFVVSPPKTCPLCKQPPLASNRPPGTGGKFFGGRLLFPHQPMAPVLLRMYHNMLIKVQSESESDSNSGNSQIHLCKCTFCADEFPGMPELMWHMERCRMLTIPCGRCSKDIFVWLGWRFHNRMECMGCSAQTLAIARKVRDALLLDNPSPENELLVRLARRV